MKVGHLRDLEGPCPISTSEEQKRRLRAAKFRSTRTLYRSSSGEPLGRVQTPMSSTN
jgi:hypothetical protein